MERIEQDLAVVQEMYRAFEQADLARTLQLCAPDVEVRQSPAVPWGGVYRGHDGVGQFLLALTTHLDSHPRTEHLFADGGGAVVQVGRTRGTVRATGAPFDVLETHVWTVADGLVVRFGAYLDVAAMSAALARPEDAALTAQR